MGVGFYLCSFLNLFCSRFIINVPVEERKDLVRICFQIELAHWYYLDFYCADDKAENKLKPCGMKEFTAHMFQVWFIRTVFLSVVEL
jgi:mRNA-decapping enzyme subunit 2